MCRCFNMISSTCQVSVLVALRCTRQQIVRRARLEELERCFATLRLSCDCLLDCEQGRPSSPTRFRIITSSFITHNPQINNEAVAFFAPPFSKGPNARSFQLQVPHRIASYSTASSPIILFLWTFPLHRHDALPIYYFTCS